MQKTMETAAGAALLIECLLIGALRQRGIIDESDIRGMLEMLERTTPDEPAARDANELASATLRSCIEGVPITATDPD